MKNRKGKKKGKKLLLNLLSGHSSRTLNVIKPEEKYRWRISKAKALLWFNMKNDVNSLRYKYTRAVTLEKVDLSPGMHTEEERDVYIYTRTAYSWRAWMHKKKVFISYQKIREWLRFHFESDNAWNRIFDTSKSIGGGRRGRAGGGEQNHIQCHSRE